MRSRPHKVLPSVLAWICDKLPDRRLAGRDSAVAYAEMQRRHAEQALLPYLRAHTRLDKAIVLDVGCGHGGATELYASVGPELAIGIDINPALLPAHVARRGANALFLAADVARLPFPSESFETAILDNSFEHVEDPAGALREIRRVLKPGGSIVLNFPSWRGPWGHHIYDFLPVPWINLIFSKNVLVDAINARATRRVTAGDDPDWVEVWRQKTVTQFVHGLNRMTVRSLMRVIRETGPWRVRDMTVSYWSRWAKPLGVIPAVAEFFTRRIDLALEKATDGHARVPVAMAFRRPAVQVISRRFWRSHAG